MPRTTPILPLVALLALAGCGSSARNEQGEAGSTIAADPNATMAEAVKDVDAASDQAIGGNEAGSDNTADGLGNDSGDIEE